MNLTDLLARMPPHPEHYFVWSDAERRVIVEYGNRRAAAALERAITLFTGEKDVAEYNCKEIQIILKELLNEQH